MMKLQGHEAAVWAVQMMPEHGLMLTGIHARDFSLFRIIIHGSSVKIFCGRQQMSGFLA